MKEKLENFDAIDPINQTHLFGHNFFFNTLVNLINKQNISSPILLSGQKGLGKSTLAFHITNYLLSINDINKYNIDDFSFTKNSQTYSLINNNIHPNFFLIKSYSNSGEIKIDQIRDLLSFLAKSTYSRDLKIVIIDNIEKLNVNAINALLKALEEPNSNTLFFIIHDNSYKLIDTIKSRCIEFKIFFNRQEKRNIFTNIQNQYPFIKNINFFEDFLDFDSPGNVINYVLSLKKANLENDFTTLTCILYLIKLYEVEKNSEIVSHLCVFIEKFYRDAFYYNKNKFNFYFNNYTKIINDLRNLQNFNLDTKNILFSIKETLLNDSK